MSSVSQGQRRSKKQKLLGEPRVIRIEEFEGAPVDARVEMIRALIPLGLAHIYEELNREVAELAGARYERKELGRGARRHGHNRGSVRLGGSKQAIRVPRVRDKQGEVPLGSYKLFHAQDGEKDELMFRRVLLGISSRNYEAAAEAVPGAIGLSRSTVSRTFIEQSAEKLKAFQERDLSQEDVVVVILDGKAFQEDLMVTALGITMGGQKLLLGFEQCGSENGRAVAQLLRRLQDRGLSASEGLLFVIDGSKGLDSAIREVFNRRGQKVAVHRCQWHKRENVISYLPKSDQKYWRGRLQEAYERPTYKEARAKLDQIKKELDEINLSAARSLEEGLEETLTLHRLGVFALLGKSLKTTNGLESIFSMAEEMTGRVDRWKNSSQKHRWLAAVLLDIETRLRRISGYRHLPRLRNALQAELGIKAKESTDLTESKRKQAA